MPAKKFKNIFYNRNADNTIPAEADKEHGNNCKFKFPHFCTSEINKYKIGKHNRNPEKQEINYISHNLVFWL